MRLCMQESMFNLALFPGSVLLSYVWKLHGQEPAWEPSYADELCCIMHMSYMSMYIHCYLYPFP